MIGYLIFGLMFVLLIVFTVMTVRNWHWSHIVILCLTFIGTVAASMGAAKTLQYRSRDLRAVKNTEEQLATVTAELNKQRFGEAAASFYSADSLRGVEEELKLRLTGRGRVWMNGTITEKAPNRVFTFPQARAAGDSHIGSLENVLVYAFLDGQYESFLDDQSDTLAYPAKFVGTFRVANEKADSLELIPELVLNDEVYQAPGSWTLFEKMPSDQHDVFTRQKEDGTVMTLAEFRQKLVETHVSAENVGMDPASSEYEALIDRLAFDGRSLGEIDRWIEENSATRINQRYVPDPEEVFVRYRFNKKSNRTYKVNGQGNLTTDGGYTLLGEAIDPALHLEGGDTLSFNPNEEVLIDLPTATGYTRADQTAIEPFNQREDVTEVDRIFRRHLHNFPSVFADFRRQAVDLGKSADELRLQNDAQAAVLANAQAQIAKRDDILTKIGQDNTNLQKDVEAISVLLQKRTAELETMQQEIADLERKINAQRSQRDGRPE